MKKVTWERDKGRELEQKLKKKKSKGQGQRLKKELPKVVCENPGQNRVEVTGESSR